jgi:hypothetical protein
MSYPTVDKQDHQYANEEVLHIKNIHMYPPMLTKMLTTTASKETDSPRNLKCAIIAAGPKACQASSPGYKKNVQSTEGSLYAAAEGREEHLRY